MIFHIIKNKREEKSQTEQEGKERTRFFQAFWVRYPSSIFADSICIFFSSPLKISQNLGKMTASRSGAENIKEISLYISLGLIEGQEPHSNLKGGNLI